MNRLAEAYVWKWWSGTSCPTGPDLQETARDSCPPAQATAVVLEALRRDSLVASSDG